MTWGERDDGGKQEGRALLRTADKKETVIAGLTRNLHSHRRGWFEEIPDRVRDDVGGAGRRRETGRQGAVAYRR
jgi:hypothetical protein